MCLILKCLSVFWMSYKCVVEESLPGGPTVTVATLEGRAADAVPLYVKCSLVSPFMPPQTQHHPCQEHPYHDDWDNEAPTGATAVVIRGGVGREPL